MKIRGFTLIELMIVIAIIGILAAVIIPMFTKKGPSTSTQYPRNATVVESIGSSSVRCENGILLKNGDPVVKDGAAVKC